MGENNIAFVLLEIGRDGNIVMILLLDFEGRKLKVFRSLKKKSSV